jgi:surfactin synthase thioesterase subunit/glycosyltransferase involved in cell wall biosynthesis
MRILLAHNSLYYPSFGGGDKSNRLLMEALAARGHEVRVVARIAKFGPEEHGRFCSELQACGVPFLVAAAAVLFMRNGVDVRTLTLDPHFRGYFSEQLAAFDPDVIITSTDDPAQLLFDIARRAGRARLVHLVRATIAVPFGPDSSSPNPARTERLNDADEIVGVSEYVADYVRRWSGLNAIHVPISLLEPGEVQRAGRFDNPYVVMVNPCAVKGIAIFLALADSALHLQFAAVPTWGTSSADLAALRKRANIRLIEPVENLDELFRQARLLLVPSVWAEARSRVVLEAMLRGVPVIASNVGGLPEAKLGVPYLLPVNPVTRYQAALDENMVPVASVPQQDIAPWSAALDRLTSDRAHWEHIADESRAAAQKYASTLSVEPFESLLSDLVRRPRKPHRVPEAPLGLSEDKQKLLALRLKSRSTQRTAASRWFPTVDPASRDRLRLFCFPHAGAGVLAYRDWTDAIPGVDVIPVLPPGRESRASEPPFERMQDLIEALTSAIRPFLGTPFAFFGHSMGAGIAFELTRSLRRAGAPQPKILIASSARAPQCRVDQSHKPEPSDTELIAELRDHGALVESPDALNLTLPLLRADSRMYRNYMYQSEPPLAIPIVAYGGNADRSVPTEDLDRWREQTTASFTRREFEGGHFYLQTIRNQVLEALRRDIGDA